MNTVTGGSAPGAGGTPSPAALTDAQILRVLDTLNQAEADEAYAALPRLASADVEAFAKQMISDHGVVRQSVLAAADDLQLDPSPSEVELQLKQEAEARVALLRAATTPSLDQTYIDLEVEAHAEALALLSGLEQAAGAAELRTLIGTLEAALQDRYDSAVALQAEL